MIRINESESTLRRLSHYARCLRMAIANGVEILTSNSIAEPCGISPASVRKDLAAYGGFGKQGSGYDTRELLDVIESILGIQDPPSVVLMGAGRLGRALLEGGIPGGNYRVIGAFDPDPELKASSFGGVRVMHPDRLGDHVSGIGDFIGVIAVTPGEAQKAADQLMKCGCRALLSFNPEPIECINDVQVSYSNMPFEMDLLTHYLRNRDR